MKKNYARGLMAITLAVVSSMVLFACGKDPMDAKLTVENYNEIVVNTTTYDEVVTLFGEPGADEELTDGAGTITWSNDKETRTVTLTFADSIVTQKAQTGLI